MAGNWKINFYVENWYKNNWDNKATLFKLKLSSATVGFFSFLNAWIDHILVIWSKQNYLFEALDYEGCWKKENACFELNK